MTLSKSALLLFVRNPVLGQVKTRLAKTIGDAKALAVYKLLLAHTHRVASDLHCDKYVFYADGINHNDLWVEPQFNKRIQHGDNLGDRMYNAFAEVFEEGYTSVMIIGSDCYQLTTEILIEGINNLNTHDSVLGPAYDGGYYLLGLKKAIPEIFENIHWSTETVFDETLNTFKEMNLSYALLPILNDIDTEEDLKAANIDY